MKIPYTTSVMAKRHTLAELKQIARASVFTVRCLDGEYRITFASGVGAYTAKEREDFAYYTTDMDDAYDTLQSMILEFNTHGLPKVAA
jgi:hypothetical protein